MNSIIEDWSATAASNAPSGATTICTSLDDNLRAIQAWKVLFEAVEGGILSTPNLAHRWLRDLGLAEEQSQILSGNRKLFEYFVSAYLQSANQR